MARKNDTPAQSDMFLTAQTGWFHVFHHIIECGDLRKIMDKSPSAIGVYLVVKSMVHYSKGVSFPSIRTICDKTGLSNATVHKSLRVLEELGYIEIEKDGRKNTYRVKEKIAVRDETGQPTAMISFDYFSTILKDVRAEINDFLLRQGTSSKYQYIHIENMNITINQQNNFDGENTQTNQTGIVDAGKAREWQNEQIEQDFQEGMSITEAVKKHRGRLAKGKS